MPNTKLMRRVLKAIKKDPSSWDQMNWRCETGMCFAGWACQIAGGKWAFGPRAVHASFLLANSQDRVESVTRVNGKDVVSAMDRAERLLGIEEYYDHNMFRSYNTLDDLEDMIAGYEHQQLETV